ncbi:MAG TPA: FmdB family zinc ribbon protein [Streptosporangiaceae bacterium]
MPTYQYACTDCGDRSEVVQRFTDDPQTVCSACGGKLRKVFSPVGIVFKGSGFYRTDSRNGSSTVPAGKDGAAAGANGSSSDGSSSDGASSGSSSSGSDAAKSSSSSGSSGSSGDSASSGSGSGSGSGARDKKSSSVAASTAT